MKKLLPLFLLFALSLPLPALAQDEDPSASEGPPEARIVEKEGANGKISFPVLIGLENFTAQEEINAITLGKTAEWNCGFDPADGVPENAFYKAGSETRLLNERVFSYTTFFNIDCGGASPQAYTESHNYDIRTGTELTLSQIFKPTFADDYDQAGLTKTLVENHKFKTPDCQDLYKEPQMWNFYITENSMVFFANLAPMAQACVEDIAIPIEDLKPVMLEANPMTGD